jgi:hypothetical protein
MAQLMYYFRFPQRGTGSYSYMHDDYGEMSADFGNTVYDYSSMTDKPGNINDAISLLTFHCGVAVDMLYGVDGSGMYNHSAARSLKNYFNFSPQTKYVFKDSTNLNWDSLIISHIDKKIPLYYAGWSVPDTVGHAFICDAYQIDTNGIYYYHFNFGWEGYLDGFYYTDTLSPSGMNFTLAQELIINACPDTSKFKYPNPALTGTTILTAEIGSFTHGSIYDCPSDMDYRWIIRPDADDIVNIHFEIQYKLAENDTIFVSSSNVNRIFTDASSNFSADVIDKEITVRLKTTNKLDSSGGFIANYVTRRPSYCKFSTTALQTKQGTIDDGSGDSRYNNNTNCSYGIVVGGVQTITITFSKFETEKDKDILYVYGGASSDVLFAELSGTLTDSVYTFKSNRLRFIFQTNGINTYSGWTLSYDTDVVGISDFEEENNRIIIYPNPVNNLLQIKNYELQMREIEIYDIVGQKLSNYQLIDDSIDISYLSAGLYFLKIGNKILKIVKN